MIHRTLITVTAVIGLSVAGAGVAKAAVLGEFVFQGTQTGVNFDGASFTPFTFDTYTFDVTNNTTDRTIDTFGLDASDNIAFFGNFLQTGGQLDRTAPALAPDPFAAFAGAPDALEDDTFFIADDEGGSGAKIILGTTDSASELSASVVASTGFSVGPGETKSIAFFSVEPGTTPTGGFGAWAIGNGQFISRIEVIPEPSSLALLGLGGFALIRRRRAAHQA